MAVINTYEQLYKILEKELDAVLFSLSEEIMDYLFEYVETNWYDVYTPEDYDRTRNLLNSISLQRVGETEFKIFFNTEKIIGVEREGWSAHISSIGRTKGQLFDDEDFIREIEIYGDYIPGHSKPLKSIENTSKWIKSSKLLSRGIREYFKKRGAQVVSSRGVRR